MIGRTSGLLGTDGEKWRAERNGEENENKGRVQGEKRGKWQVHKPNLDAHAIQMPVVGKKARSTLHMFKYPCQAST